MEIFVLLLKDHPTLPPLGRTVCLPGLFRPFSVFVFHLPSPARHGLHGSFQRTIQGYDESHRPGHHEDQRHEDGADRDQDDSQEDTLYGEEYARARAHAHNVRLAARK